MSIYEDGTYYKNNPSWHVEDSLFKASQILKMINKHNIHPHRITDVGCGAGEIIYQLSLQMPEETLFFGYEISPQAYKLCLKHKDNRLQYFLKDVLEADIYDDVILVIDVIERIENYFDFLRELKKKGEYKIFNIPLELWLKAMFPNRLLNSRKNSGHLHFFNKELALESLMDCGYELIDYYLTPAFNAPSNSYFVKLLNMFRKTLYFISPNASSRLLGGSSLLVLTK